MDSARIEAGWVDSYVRNQLTDEQEAEFEVALLESQDLQDELDDVLRIRQLVAQHPEAKEGASGNFTRARSGSIDWLPLAMAASLLAAVGSTALFLQARQQAVMLEDQLVAAGLPVTQVLTVPVDIMRSAGATPAVIVQKPTGASAILLDIELPPALAERESVSFRLQAGNKTIHTWTAAPGTGGRSSVVLDGDSLPEGRVYLELSASDGSVSDRRLLEFRASR